MAKSKFAKVLLLLTLIGSAGLLGYHVWWSVLLFGDVRVPLLLGKSRSAVVAQLGVPDFESDGPSGYLYYNKPNSVSIHLKLNQGRVVRIDNQHYREAPVWTARGWESRAKVKERELWAEREKATHRSGWP